MKRNRIVTGVLLAVLVVFSVGSLAVRREKDRLQESIGPIFAQSYYELTIHLLNAALVGNSEAALHRYNTENTKHSCNIPCLYQFTSYKKKRNGTRENIRCRPATAR